MSISIRGWDKHYESAETRKVKNLTWVRITNRFDATGYRRLMKRPDGLEILAVFVLLVQVASRMPRRGVLEDPDGVPLRPGDLADKTGAPESSIRKASQVLLSKDIGWLIGGWDDENLPESPDVPGRPPENPAVEERSLEERSLEERSLEERSLEERRSKFQVQNSQAPPPPSSNVKGKPAAAPLTAEEWDQPDPDQIAQQLARDLAPLHWFPSSIPKAHIALRTVLLTATDPQAQADAIRRSHASARANLPRPRNQAKQEFCYWISDGMYLHTESKASPAELTGMAKDLFIADEMERTGKSYQEVEHEIKAARK